MNPSQIISRPPSDMPSYVDSIQGDTSSMIPSVKSIAPSDQPSTVPSQAPTSSSIMSDYPSLVPTFTQSNGPSLDPSSSASVLPSNMPSLDGETESIYPTMTVTMKSGVPSEMPIVDSSLAASDVPSLSPTVLLDHPSLYPSMEPSSLPSLFALSDVPSLQESPERSETPSLIPSDMPSNDFGTEGAESSSDTPSTQSATSHPSVESSESPSLAPSAFPSLVRSTGPSDIPSTSPESISSDIPSIQPSIEPSDLPSLVPQRYSQQPSNNYSQQGYPDPTDEPTSSPGNDSSVSSPVRLAATSQDMMDNETLAIFEEVLEQQFLPQVLPLVYPATYSEIRCIVISQTFLNGTSQRRLQEDSRNQGQTARLAVTTDTVQILLRISSNVNPPAENFDDLVELALQEYPKLLQQLLSNQTEFFAPVPASSDSGNSTPPPVAAIERTPTAENSDDVPVMVIVGAVVGGCVLAILAALFISSRSDSSPQTQRRLDDGCSLVLSDNEEDIYPFGRIGDGERGGMMIQTSFSDISGSNLPSQMSPGPYPLVSPTNVPTGEDGVENHSNTQTSQPLNQATSPVLSRRNGNSPVVSPKSQNSTSSRNSRFALSPRSRNLPKVSQSHSDATSPKSVVSGDSSVAGNVKKQGKTYTTTTFSEETSQVLTQHQRSPKTGRFDPIAERASEETSWGRDDKTSTDEEGSDVLSGLALVGSVTVDDPSIHQPPRQLVPDPIIEDSQAPRSKNIFNCLVGKKENDSLEEASASETLVRPVDSLGSFLTVEEDTRQGVTQPKPIPELSTAPSGPKIATLKPLSINTKHAAHTGLVLNDLGDMEKEWKGQLESTTTTTSTTPKRENREKFKKPPRNILYDGRVLNDGSI